MKNPQKALKFLLLFYSVTGFGFLAASDSSNPETLSQTNLMIVENKIKDVEWLAEQEIVINAVLAQNQLGLSMSDILARDKQWRGSEELTAFKKSFEEGECGLFIESLVKNGKVFNEIFITDNQGANVKAYPTTSDYWQGDEEKWSLPFNQDRIYIGPAAFDQSSQQRSVQVSVAIKHQQKIIGVLVAGIKMSFVEYKALQQLLSIETQEP